MASEFQSEIKKYLSHNSSFFDEYREEKDPVESWPLMGSPVPVLFILSAYILMTIIGRKIMKNKPSFNLKPILILYNAVQVFLMAKIACAALENNIFKNGILLAGCDFPVYTREPYILNGCWLYFICKLLGLQETAFLIMSKRIKYFKLLVMQVYHQVFMVLFTWCYLKYGAGGDSTVLIFLDCGTLVFVYMSNLISVFAPTFYSLLDPYLLILQVMQYIMSLFYIAHGNFSSKCSFSGFFTAVLALNMIISTTLLLTINTKYPEFYLKVSMALCYVILFIDAAYHNIAKIKH